VKSLILSCDIGKRLKPITDYVSKLLVPVNNIPIIEYANEMKSLNYENFVLK
jgi:NDP-sugar pyrophosphorylase family protein